MYSNVDTNETYSKLQHFQINVMFCMLKPVFL